MLIVGISMLTIIVISQLANKRTDLEGYAWAWTTKRLQCNQDLFLLHGFTKPHKHNPDISTQVLPKRYEHVHIKELVFKAYDHREHGQVHWQHNSKLQKLVMRYSKHMQEGQQVKNH